MMGLRALLDAGSRRQIDEHDGRRPRRRRSGLLAAFPLVLILWLVMPGVASAESLCTDTWVGPAEGPWQTAADWSLGTVPSSSDVACIGSGKTVKVTEGTNQTGVVQGEGSLAISGGSLEVANALEASTITTFSITGGVLTGAGEVDVTGSFSGGQGKLEGSGTTLIKPGASGTINNGPLLNMAKRTLVNEGTLTIPLEGGIDGKEGATIINRGTFTVNGQKESFDGLFVESPGPTPTLINTGTVQKTEGTGTSHIAFAVDNESTISAKTGILEFSGGGTSGKEKPGSWSASSGAQITFGSGTFALGSTVPLSGSIALIAATVTAGTVEGSAASVNVSFSGCCEHGKLEINGSTSSTIKSLTVTGTLAGTGEVDVTSSFSGGGVSGARMEGSGTTVIEPGASGTVNSGPELNMAKRTLVNEGSLTVQYPEGGIDGKEGATIINHGTFTINGQGEAQGLFAESPGPTPSLVNTGTIQKTEGTGTTPIRFTIDNESTVTTTSGTLEFTGGGTSGVEKVGSWSASGTNGQIVFGFNGSFALGSTVQLSGPFVVIGTVTAGVVEGSAASLNISFSGCCTHGTVEINGTSPSTLSSLSLTGTLTGSGEVDVTKSFLAAGISSTHMLGSGRTVLKPGSSGTINNGPELNMAQRTLVNEGTLTVPLEGGIDGKEGATIINHGTFTINGQGEGQGLFVESPGPTPLLVNTGTVQKTEGTGTTHVRFAFENYGTIEAHTGRFEFGDPIIVTEPSTQYGGSWAPGQLHSTCGKPVSCATGNESETQTDLAVGGRGVGLDLTRTYNSQAGAAGEHGAFGYGWTSSFSDHLVVNKTSKLATLYQANGGTVPFTEGTGGSFTAPAWTQDILSGSAETGYALTLANQTKFQFAGSNGRLESVTDRNGNATTLAYGETGRLETITDPAGRKITLAYNAEGLVESAKDPMGHTVKYTYEGGNLKSVTEPGEASARWQFKYDGSHEITEMIDGRGGKTINEYNGAHQVISQKDPMERTLSFEYEPFRTKITNKATGAVTDEHFTSNDEPSSITHGFGTSSASTESFTYNEGGYVTSLTDGNGHATKYTYDGGSNRTSATDANNHERKWTYDSTHDIETMTTPKGETTTIKRDSHGNPETISRPAPGSTTQTTTYKYDSHGNVESMEDPLKRVWKYEYDNAGDRTAEVDPEGDKRTWGYNEDSQKTSTVSPRGNVTGGEPAKYTTMIERDERGRALKVTDPLGHATKYAYDANGNLETMTDPNSHTTTYTYDADNERIKVKMASGIVTETGYDGAGQVITQTDGNKHETKYVRNILEQVTEQMDPLGRKTTKEYDAAGNLKKLTDAAARTSTYTYDPANRLTEVSYSDVKTHAVKYEYDADGDRTSMVDGTGTSSYTYDQLDRLTESKDGRGNKTSYEYDLANQQTKITYPNGNAVTQGYDKAGRLERVTDWLEHTTRFAYDPNSNLTTITFPTGTSNIDKYAYNEADQMSEVHMTKSAETLASLVYARDNDGQVKTITSKGLPGEEKPSYEYDTNNRVTKAGTNTYEYDSADNPTKIPGSTSTYDNADELKTGTSITYTYDELGERIKRAPTSGAATTYGYDQAGNLISVTRPKEAKIAEIKDTYAYDGNELLASQTISGTTSFLAWDMTRSLPVILNDGTNSYIYGPGGLPVEQISSGGTVTYLHHDQQGSSRLLTGSTGTVTGSTTFDAYGNKTGSTGTSTTPLGYDGQYTSSDTGLIYLRARVYDPATAQFLSRDPLVELTLAPYNYSRDNPLNQSDPRGLVTVGICVSAEAALGIRVGVGACGQVSSSGEVGASGTINGGVASGAGVSAGAGIQSSNAEHISELGGPFAHLGGSIHAGGGASADTFYGGDNACGTRIVGGEVSLGIGAGADQYVTGSETETIATGF